MKPNAIILAGGKSSRMGEDKGMLMYDGKPMIMHIIDSVKPLVDEVVIISNQSIYNELGFPVFEDLVKDKGPLAGIYTGLLYSTSMKNIVLSCDVPFVSTELLEFLIKNNENSEVTIPSKDNKTHQLIGVYSKTCEGVFKTELENDQRKIRKALEHVNLNIVNADNFSEKNFSNINTKEEFNKILCS